MTDHIPIEPFDDEPDATGAHLGPAGIEEAMRPLSAILGEDVFVFVRNDVDTSKLETAFVSIPGPELVRMLPALIEGRPGLTLVSDGHFSHAITVREARNDRLVFFDPWNTSSFLQEGRNIAGIRAHTEGEGLYSVSPDELARVIIAQGVAGLGTVPGLVVPPEWEAFRAGDFYTFFHLRPDGDPVPFSGGLAHPHKPGAFKAYLDLGFEVDEAGRVRAGVVEVQHDWLLGPNRPMAMDLLTHFVGAMTDAHVDLTAVGIDYDGPVLPSPDRQAVAGIVGVLGALRFRGQPQASRWLDRMTALLAVLARQHEEASLALGFVTIRMVSRGGVLLTRIEHRA